MDDGKRLVSIRALPNRGEGQLRVGCIERRGDAPPREMTAQAEAIPLDRMRLIDRPEASQGSAAEETPPFFLSFAEIVFKFPYRENFFLGRDWAISL